VPRYSASARTAALPTSVRGPSIYAAASANSPRIREIGIFNTTTTAFAVTLNRMTARGTPGAGITAAKHDPGGPAADATPYQTHTADATASDEVARASIGAAIGAAMVWTFGDNGLQIPDGANTAGLALLLPTGTAQHFDFYWVWDE
jgi:hypothetical protein